MIKIIIFYMFLFIVFQCIDVMPTAEEVSKIMIANREAHEIEMQQVREHNNNYWKRIAEEAKQRRDEFARLREAARPTIEQFTVAFCESKKNDVTSLLLEAIKRLKNDFDMDMAETMNNMPRDIAYCMVEAAMNAHFYTEFNVNRAEFIIATGRPVDESKIVMEKPQLCGDTLQYAISCGEDRTDCMLFQMEFNKRAEVDWDSCMNPLDYGTMHQIGSFSTGFFCL